MPPIERLRQCAAMNPHGFGFATAERVYKTMNLQDLVNELGHVDNDEAAVIHFRCATHGSIRTANCHPFRDDRSGVSFAHNGVLDIMPADDMTDSETAFRMVLVPVIWEHGLWSDEFVHAVGKIIGPSRFAFIDSDRHIRLFGNFIEQGGCYYSNGCFI